MEYEIFANKHIYMNVNSNSIYFNIIYYLGNFFILPIINLSVLGFIIIFYIYNNHVSINTKKNKGKYAE